MSRAQKRSKARSRDSTDEGANDTQWDLYVASWPAWRSTEACTGPCPRARVCGRAGMCLQEHARLRAVVYALARLSVQAHVRPPVRRLTVTEKKREY